MKVRVVRPLHVAGQRKEVGEIVDLPFVTAKEAIHIGRAEAVDEQPVASGPMTIQSTEPASEPVVETRVQPKKRRKDAEEQKA